MQATLGMAGAIIGEAALSFLGLGVQPPTPSWGTMLNGGRAHLLDAPHLTIFPGLAIALLVLGFNFLGDGLRDLADPKRRCAETVSSQRPPAAAFCGSCGRAPRLDPVRAQLAASVEPGRQRGDSRRMHDEVGVVGDAAPGSE